MNGFQLWSGMKIWIYDRSSGHVRGRIKFDLCAHKAALILLDRVYAVSTNKKQIIIIAALKIGS